MGKKKSRRGHETVKSIIGFGASGVTKIRISIRWEGKERSIASTDRKNYGLS